MSLIPPWLEQYQMDEALMAQAYDQVDPAARARIKTALACYFALWPPHADQNSHGRILNGFDLRIHEEPAPWVLAVVAPGYSPARVMAALMPAILAKVSPVLVLCSGLPDSLLRSALELAGLEDIFHDLPVTGPQSPRALLEHMQNRAPDGRLLFLCPPADSGPDPWPGLAQMAASRGTPQWQSCNAPFIQVEGAKGMPVNLMSQLHPDARVVPDLPGVSAKEGNICACFGQETRVAQHHFAAGLEACWLHQGIMPAWFRNQRLSATFNPGTLP